jgi:hypothetical protein
VKETGRKGDNTTVIATGKSLPPLLFLVIKLLSHLHSSHYIHFDRLNTGDI